jgi:hypothetical protein
MATPLATATRRPPQLVSTTPTLATLSKLWVGPLSRSASSPVPLMVTAIFIVRLMHGWMPIRAWREMVSSPSSGESPSSSSSSTTSMTNSCLQCCRWHGMKSLSHLKHFPSLRHWMISNGERRMELAADLLTDAEEAAGVATEAVGAGGVVVRPEKHDDDWRGVVRMGEDDRVIQG